LIPRLTIRHTSEMHEGQIYIPRANSALLIGVLLLVAIFHTSDALASAYGVAVTTTMVVDGVLGFIVIWKAWGWRPWAAAIMMVPLISVDAIFLSSNLLKIVEGAVGTPCARRGNRAARFDVAPRDHAAAAQNTSERSTARQIDYKP
jgi:KUP system potassium uptake protein